MLEQLKTGVKLKQVEVEDWAYLHKAIGGKVTTLTSKSADPGAARGATVGGAAGLILAVVSGPIGIGAVVGGAAIGAVTAALKDSGFKNDDLAAVSRLAADGRSGILVSVPLDKTDQYDAFVTREVVFDAADNKHQVDIVPGRDFDDALEEYRRQEDA